MIEYIIKRYLDNHLSVPAFFERDANTPEKCVILEKTSSGKREFTTDATFAFQCYAPTLEQAALLNEEVKRTIEQMIELDEISSIRLNSDYNFTDTSLKSYRYQAVFDIYYF